MENKTTDLVQSTNYKDLMVEAGKQLGLRKKDIFKRVILTTWPMIIFGLAVVLTSFYYQSHQDIWNDYALLVYVGIFCWAVFAILYGAVIRTIFSMEKRIWIDSFFDGKNLSSSQSWHIATKLFFPSIIFRIKLFIRYYAIVWVLYFVLIAGIIISATKNLGMPWWTFPIIILGFPVLMWIYSHYYLQAYLRFVWWLFLDTYGSTNSSFSNIIIEMNKLNDISKGDSFKKALIAEVGSDSITIIANTATESILTGFSAFNEKAGAIISSVVKIPAQEMASQSSDFAKLSAIFLLYRKARELYGESAQLINEKLYSL
jgi:hypothetical protein